MVTKSRETRYNNFWWLGNILAGWVTYGTNLHLKDSWAWRVPTVLQAGLPGISMCLILFFPESPRWLINNKRQEEGLRVLTKYHGNGNEQDPVVQLQYHEIVEQAKLFRDENPWWDYRELVNTRAARWRITMVIGMAFIGQLSGNNVVSVFPCDAPHVPSSNANASTATGFVLYARDDQVRWYHRSQQAAAHQRD